MTKKRYKYTPRAPDLDGGIGSHAHRWTTSGWIGHAGVSFRCIVTKHGNRCEAHFERATTAAEKKFVTAKFDFWSKKPQNNVHLVFHEFLRLFRDKTTNEWKFQGYDLMKRVERWAEKHPGDVTVVRVDDDHHSNSDLVLIDHKTKRRYMGITCINIPQHGGPPSEFFLYPEARDSLLRSLRAMVKPAREAAKNERIEEAARGKAWSRLVTLPPSTFKPGKA